MAVYPFFHRLANAAVSTLAYLVKTIWPHPLVVFYPYREAIPAWQWLGSAGLLAAASAAALWYGQKYRYLVCGWFWYLITLLPVIGLVQVGAQAMADRYTYIPLIGIFIAGVWLVHATVSRLAADSGGGLRGGRTPAAVRCVILAADRVLDRQRAPVSTCGHAQCRQLGGPQ